MKSNVTTHALGCYDNCSPSVMARVVTIVRTWTHPDMVIAESNLSYKSDAPLFCALKMSKTI